MTASPEKLVLVFTSTCGAGGELLGSDEKETVQVVWQILNLVTKKVNGGWVLLSACDWECVCLKELG